MHGAAAAAAAAAAVLVGSLASQEKRVTDAAALRTAPIPVGMAAAATAVNADEHVMNLARVIDGGGGLRRVEQRRGARSGAATHETARREDGDDRRGDGGGGEGQHRDEPTEAAVRAW